MIHIQKKFPKATCWSSVVPQGNRGLAEIYKVGSKMITFFAYSQCLGIMRRPVFYRVVYSKHQKKKKKKVLYSLLGIGMQKQEVKRQIPGVTGKFGLGVQNEAGQRLTEFCQENALVISNTLFQQYKRRLYTWTSLSGKYLNQFDYILCSRRWRHFIQSAKTRLGADCGSDHQIFLAKFRLKLKKAGEMARPAKYDLKSNPL